MNVAQSVQKQRQWQGRSRELSPAIRETLQAIDATEVASAKAREDLEASRKAVPIGIGVAVGGGLLGAGSGVALALTGAGIAIPLTLIGALVGIMGTLVSISSKVGVRQSTALVQQKIEEHAALARQLDDRCASERAANEQSLLKAGGAGMATVGHVEADPYVGVAAKRYADARRTVARDKALLEGTRSERFTVKAERAREIWSNHTEVIGTASLLAMLGGAAGVGFAVNAAAGSPFGMVAGLCTMALEVMLWQKHGGKVIAPGVDRALKKEIAAEIARQEPRLDALRKTYDVTRQSALEHYVALLDGASQQPAPPPEKVRVEPDQIVIGGVKVPRSEEE